MAKRKYIMLELLEPMEGSEHPAGSAEAVAELYDYLENEFNNHGHRVHMQMIQEDDRGGFSSL
jgi:hypothetical protein